MFWFFSFCLDLDWTLLSSHAKPVLSSHSTFCIVFHACCNLSLDTCLILWHHGHPSHKTPRSQWPTISLSTSSKSGAGIHALQWVASGSQLVLTSACSLSLSLSMHRSFVFLPSFLPFFLQPNRRKEDRDKFKRAVWMLNKDIEQVMDVTMDRRWSPPKDYNPSKPSSAARNLQELFERGGPRHQ